MAVRRVVANVAAGNVAAGAAFYRDVLGMRVVMDRGWIVTFAGEGEAMPQVSVASEGGSGMPVPDFSVEVDDLDDVHARVAAAGIVVEYGPVVEPWGVMLFFVRDPFGRLVNILAHH